MKWYWKVRLYNPNGGYFHSEIVTKQNLQEIGTICGFYKNLTGCDILIEGMSECPKNETRLREAFERYYHDEPRRTRTVTTCSASY